MADQTATPLFRQNYNSTNHIVINQGGTSSGKTYAIEQVLFCLACATQKLVITVVGQDIPNLKAGALRDAASIYSSSKALQVMIKNYNKTDRLFEFYNGSTKYISSNHKQGESVGKRATRLISNFGISISDLKNFNIRKNNHSPNQLNPTQSTN